MNETAKLLWRGDFNWNGLSLQVHRWAFTSDDAFILMMVEVAKQIGKPFRIVRNYFLGGGDHYHIQRVIPKPKKGKKKTILQEQLNLF